MIEKDKEMVQLKRKKKTVKLTRLGDSGTR